MNKSIHSETDSSNSENYISLNIEIKNEANKKKIFNINYREKTSLFTNIENILSIKEEPFMKRKRNPKRRRRRDNQDNIRKKIKRGFINKSLIKKINELLKNSGSKLYFEKLPQNFVCDITKSSNNKILNMTLEEIFENKELYDQKYFNNYNHNINVLKSKDIQECQELKEILNKKYCELFEEYINSKEFQIDEINRLKNNEMDDAYIEKYIYLALHFIEYYH
jgi:hypothetical protein